jgi:hypothetical protein
VQVVVEVVVVVVVVVAAVVVVVVVVVAVVVVVVPTLKALGTSMNSTSQNTLASTFEKPRSTSRSVCLIVG